MTPEKAVELINGCFTFDIEGTILDVTPIDWETGNYIVEDRFNIDLSNIDVEMMSKLLLNNE